MTSVWPSLALTAAPLPLELSKDGDLAGATEAEAEAWPARLAEFAGLFGALLGSEPAGPGVAEQGWSPELPAASEGFQLSKPAALSRHTAAYALGSSVSWGLSNPAPLYPHTAGSARAQESPPRADRLRFPAVSLPLAADTPHTVAGSAPEAPANERGVGLLPTAIASEPAQQAPPADASERLASQLNVPPERAEETASASASAPVAESVRPARGFTEVTAQGGARELVPTGGENAAHGDATGRPHALGPILPAREPLGGEPAFAVRILPSEPVSLRNGQWEGAKAPPGADVRAAMKAQRWPAQEPVADGRSGATQRVGPTVEARAVMSRPHAEGLGSAPAGVLEPPAQRAELPAAMAVAVSRPPSPEVPAEATPSETSPSWTATSRLETAPLAEPQQPSVRRITLQLDGASGGRVRLDVRDRAGEIQVAVSARGAALAATLREGAAQLVSGLQARGFAAELLAGGTAAASSWGAGEGSARQETTPDSRPLASGWEHGSGEGHGGRRRQAQEAHEESLD